MVWKSEIYRVITVASISLDVYMCELSGCILLYIKSYKYKDLQIITMSFFISVNLLNLQPLASLQSWSITNPNCLFSLHDKVVFAPGLINNKQNNVSFKLLRRIEEFLLCYRHQHISPSYRWVAPIIDYIKYHMWEDSVTGRDIWNGWWTLATLHQLLPEAPSTPINLREYTIALAWLQRLTDILQPGQQTLYRIRRVELLSNEATERHATLLR